MLKLSELVGEMDMQVEEYMTMVNIKTGEIVSIDLEEARVLDDMEEEELSKDQMELLDMYYGDGYVRIPSKHEIHEYHMMSDFVYHMNNDMIGQQLSQVISGRGAFRRFKDTAIQLDVIDEWYKFRDNAYKIIAVEFCKDNKLEYVDDM
ncbi:MAG: hypothetical protein JEZ08_05090 [Clostridiales bacterium]|nr:hypothetical protein [Clostridiales bacterium]